MKCGRHSRDPSLERWQPCCRRSTCGHVLTQQRSQQPWRHASGQCPGSSTMGCQSMPRRGCKHSNSTSGSPSSSRIPWIQETVPSWPLLLSCSISSPSAARLFAICPVPDPGAPTTSSCRGLHTSGGLRVRPIAFINGIMKCSNMPDASNISTIRMLPRLQPRNSSPLAHSSRLRAMVLSSDPMCLRTIFPTPPARDMNWVVCGPGHYY